MEEAGHVTSDELFFMEDVPKRWVVMGAATSHLPGGVLLLSLSAAVAAIVLAYSLPPGATLILATWALLLAPTPAMGLAPGLHKLVPAVATGIVVDALWGFSRRGGGADY